MNWANVARVGNTDCRLNLLSQTTPVLVLRAEGRCDPGAALSKSQFSLSERAITCPVSTAGVKLSYHSELGLA